MDGFQQFERLISGCRAAGAIVADSWFIRFEHAAAVSEAEMDARRLGAMIGIRQAAEDLAADIPIELRAEWADRFAALMFEGFLQRVTELTAGPESSGGSA